MFKRLECTINTKNKDKHDMCSKAIKKRPIS